MPRSKQTKRRSAAKKAAKGTGPSTVVSAVQSAPCHVTPDTRPYNFQVKASDMPIKVKLCEDDKGSPAKSFDFNGVTIYDTAKSPAQVVSGQPTGLTKTGFTLLLPVGIYDVVMILDHVPNAQVAYVFEDCDKANPLARILVFVTPTGSFYLKVA